MSTTFEEYRALVKDTEEKADRMARAAKVLIGPASMAEGFVYTVKLTIIAHLLLRRLERMEKSCAKCTEVCDFPIKGTLGRAVSILQKGLSAQEGHYPRFVLRPLSAATARLEDKVENFWLASDKELKDMFTKFAEGVRHPK